METETLLQIVSLLDSKKEYYYKLANEYQDDIAFGKFLAYKDLSEHYQSYIEAQLNAAEIQMGE